MTTTEEQTSETGNEATTEDADMERMREEIERNARRRLSPQEYELLAYRYGLDGGQPHTCQETVDRFNVSRERILAIENKGLRGGCPKRRKKLRDYV